MIQPGLPCSIQHIPPNDRWLEFIHAHFFLYIIMSVAATEALAKAYHNSVQKYNGLESRL